MISCCFAAVKHFAKLFVYMVEKSNTVRLLDLETWLVVGSAHMVSCF